MKTQSTLRPYLIRLGIVSMISLVIVLIVTEGAYLLQKDKKDRAPQTIQLVIPPGTAQRVAQGEPVPDIPSEMSFVVGDVLEVKNEDSQPHQLGPIWVPPGSTGSLVMEQADNLAYSCSFQNTQYLGIDVVQPTTFSIRLIGLSVAVPTTALLIFLYSLAARPIKQ